MNIVNDPFRRAGKSVALALNAYAWLKTAKEGSKGLLVFPDRTVTVKIDKVEIR